MELHHPYRTRSGAATRARRASRRVVDSEMVRARQVCASQVCVVQIRVGLQVYPAVGERFVVRVHYQIKATVRSLKRLLHQHVRHTGDSPMFNQIEKALAQESAAEVGVS
jgi:hypothetical protein